MPIEIKELLIRAFVTDPKTENQREEQPIQKKMNAAEATLAMVSKMLNQEKER